MKWIKGKPTKQGDYIVVCRVIDGIYGKGIDRYEEYYEADFANVYPEYGYDNGVASGRLVARAWGENDGGLHEVYEIVAYMDADEAVHECEIMLKKEE